MTASIRHEGILTTPNDLEITMQRVFRASAATLYDVWTKPEHVRRWYGVRGTTVTVCDIDLRAGGAWRWVVSRDGMDIAFSGVFTDLTPPLRFQRTEIFEAIGGPGCVVTVSFDENGNGETMTTMNMRFPDKASRDMTLQSGMELGVQECYANIDKLVLSL